MPLAILALVALAPAGAGARPFIDYQFRLTTSFQYANHWFTGRDPGPVAPEEERRRILLPEAAMWRNSPGVALGIATERSQWELSYAFGYSWFPNEESLDGYDNRLDLLGQIALGPRTALALVEQAMQSRYNYYLLPFLMGFAKPYGIFDLSRLTMISSMTRAMLDHRFSPEWELRPELEVEIATTYGDLPPELGAALTDHARFTTQSTLLRHFDRDVLYGEIAWHYVAVGAPPDIPPHPPLQLQPISMAVYGRDFMLLSAVAGWSRQLAPWFVGGVRLGYVLSPRDELRQGLVGGLRLRLYDERWTAILEYARRFDATGLSAATLSDDGVSLEVRRKLPRTLSVELDSAAHQTRAILPDPGGASHVSAANQFFVRAGLSMQVTRQLELAVGINYRRWWGAAVPLPFDAWMPEVHLTVAFPERTGRSMDFEEAVRRTTREPLDEERRIETERRPTPSAPPPPGVRPLDAGGPPPPAPPPSNAPPGWRPEDE